MNESDFSREIRKNLEQYGYFKKMVGGMFIAPGIPDILGCYKGQFIGIECKQIKTIPKRKTSILWKDLFKADQILNLRSIEQNGGVALGLIHLRFDPKNQIVIALTPHQIELYSTITIIGYEQLKNDHGVVTIGKMRGVWDVWYLLSCFSPSTASK